MDDVYFPKTIVIRAKNFSDCRNGDLKFDIQLSDEDGPLLKLIGCRWDGERFVPPARRLPHNRENGQPAYWKYFLFGNRFERAMLKVLELNGKVPAASAS